MDQSILGSHHSLYPKSPVWRGIQTNTQKAESIGQDAKRLLRGTLKMWECKHIDVVKRPQLPNEKSAAVILQGYAVESTRGYGLVGPRSPLLCCKGDSTILRTCNFDYCLLMLSVALGTYFKHHLLTFTGPARQDSALIEL